MLPGERLRLLEVEVDDEFSKEVFHYKVQT